MYFKSRPLESQIASLASKQSQVLESRDDYSKRIEEFKTKDLSCEGVWGGFWVEPFRFEFWTAGEHRMHDREVYELNADDQSWKTYHLYP
jgi:pyridoxamine 5'-phosphate oxidase